MWARELFQNYYHNEIAQLLHTFPSDHVTSQGVKFWTGTKRCPTPLNFNPELVRAIPSFLGFSGRKLAIFSKCFKPIILK